VGEDSLGWRQEAIRLIVRSRTGRSAMMVSSRRCGRAQRPAAVSALMTMKLRRSDSG
jgi:hypothetical protein